MKLISMTMATLAATFLLVGPALAVTSPASVPELDGGMAVIAMGLTAAIVAIIRETRRK